MENAVEAAQAFLRTAGKDARKLDGYTWHGNRHTFASRLVMSGVDLRSVQELGGWKTLTMVQRYGHLAPERLAAAVERLVPPVTEQASIRPAATVELRRNIGAAESADVAVSVSRLEARA